jgi:hypothetical protein
MTCPADGFQHGPPTVLFDKPQPGYWQRLSQWHREATDRIVSGGDFRGGGFRWDRSVKRLGIGWDPECKVPEAKVHIQGDGRPLDRPLGLRVDTDGAFFGDISESSYSTEEVFFEIAPPAVASRVRGFRYAGGAKTALAGGELIDVNITPADVEFGSGTLLNGQAGINITSPTWSATTAKTINIGTTLRVYAPTKGANVSWQAGTGISNVLAIQALGVGGVAANISGVDGFVPGPAFDFCMSPLAGINLPDGSEYHAVKGVVTVTDDTLRWNGAPGATQRWIRCDPPRYGRASGSSTITTAATVYIAGAPIAGTGITITNPYALWVDQGNVQFDGDLTVNGTLSVGGASLLTGTLAAGQVAYGSAANTIAGSNNLWFDSANIKFAVGTNTPAEAFVVRVSYPGGHLSRLTNTSTAAYSSTAYYNSSDAFRCAVGYANSTVANTFYQSRSFIALSGADFVIGNGTVSYLYAFDSSSSLRVYGVSDDSREGNVQTTGNTATTLLSFTPTADRTLIVKAFVAARRSDDAAGAGYEVRAVFRVTSGGAVTQIGTSGIAAHEDDATWVCDLDTDGTLVRLRVTGVAATTIRWTGKMLWVYGAN